MSAARRAMIAFEIVFVQSQEEPEPSNDVVLVGTVTRVESAPVSNSPKNWIVTVSVEQVLSGKLDERTFAFRVHSPARAGLVVGSQYTIRATSLAEGYVVDEHQWNP